MEYKGYKIKMVEPVIHEYEFEEDVYGNPTNEYEIDAYPSHDHDIYFDIFETNGQRITGNYKRLAEAKRYIDQLVKEAA